MPGGALPVVDLCGPLWLRAASPVGTRIRAARMPVR